MTEKKLLQEEQTLIETQDSVLDLNATVAAHLHRLKPSDWRELALETYLNCEICGEELLFTHVTQFVSLQVEEEAHCPSCRIQNVKRTHRLQ